MHGRWISRDPIGEMGGLNLYGFVGNNGLLYCDYLGQRGFFTNFIQAGRSFYGAVGNDLGNHAVLIGTALKTAAGQELYYIGEGPFQYFDRNMNRIDSTSRDVESIFNGLNQYIDDPSYRKASDEFFRSGVDEIATLIDTASRDPDCMEQLLRKANVATIEALIVQLTTKGIGAGSSAANSRLRAALQKIESKGANITENSTSSRFSQLREAATFLRDEAGITDVAYRRQVIESFGADMRVGTFKGQAYQYSGVAGSSSRYLTPTSLSNPVQQLALAPMNSATILQQYSISSTRALMGTAAPQNFGIALPGGAQQIFIPSRSLLTPTLLIR